MTCHYRAEVRPVAALSQALHPDSGTSQACASQTSFTSFATPLEGCAPHAGPPSQKGFGLDSWMLGSSPLDSHAVHTAAMDEGTIFITVHALISAGRNPWHCMAPQSLSKLTLPPCLPAVPPSPTPPSASQLCPLKASLTQL